MNIVDFWKQAVTHREDYIELKKDKFADYLTQHVPNWREQVKDKKLWPELHCQTRGGIGEMPFFFAILEVAGIEYAYYLIENSKKYYEWNSALRYCLRYMSTEWNNFPEAVKKKIIHFHLGSFLRACRKDIQIWKNLSAEWKQEILNDVAYKENLHCSDLLLFNLWEKELDLKPLPYILFRTKCFRIAQLNYSIYFEDRDPDIWLKDLTPEERERKYKEELKTAIQQWDVPTLTQDELGGFKMFTPSKRITDIWKIALQANDAEFATAIDKVISSIRKSLSIPLRRANIQRITKTALNQYRTNAVMEKWRDDDSLTTLLLELDEED